MREYIAASFIDCCCMMLCVVLSHLSILTLSTAKILVPEDPAQFHFINQGCLSVDGMDDREEMRLADVCM